MLSKPTIAILQPACPSSSRNSWSISGEARERSTVSARIWAAKFGVKPAPTMARSSSVVRRLLTTKLSSWKKSSLVDSPASSARTWSLRRWRTTRENWAVTEQNSQSKGHPHWVMAGLTAKRSCPSIRERSGIGRRSNSVCEQRDRAGL
jgi:hypothetical protein